MARRTGRRPRISAPKVASTGAVVRQEVRVGPLPSPEELQNFEDVLPGLADRIVALAEGHAKNYWRNDRAQRFSAILGQVFSFVMGASLVGGGIWLINAGYTTSGLAVLAAPVAGIVAAFRRRS